MNTPTTYPFRSFYLHGKGHHDVEAATSLQARDKATEHWQRLHPRRKIRGDDVTVVRLDVTHSTAGVG